VAAESPIALLRAHARHAPWNARGLAAHVTALVDAAGVRPTNASARAAPSARSIRFYVANGLLERPEGTGTAATYNYRHFLQLLAIKIRQREGITLDGIRAEMKDVTGESNPTTTTPPRAGVACRSPTASSSTSATTPPPRATTL
jgi:DNA-binding transcriptional MerR regulator